MMAFWALLYRHWAMVSSTFGGSRSFFSHGSHDLYALTQNQNLQRVLACSSLRFMSPGAKNLGVLLLMIEILHDPIYMYIYI